MKRKFIATIKIGNKKPFKFNYVGNSKEEAYEVIKDFFLKSNISDIDIRIGKEVK